MAPAASAHHIHGRTMTRERTSPGTGNVRPNASLKREKEKPDGTVPGPGLYCPWAGAYSTTCRSNKKLRRLMKMKDAP